MANTKKQEIESIIKKAKSIKVCMYKEKLHGPTTDKFVVYMVYKIGKLEITNDLVSYKGEIFPDSNITSMVKRRAIELDPDVMAICKREAEEWTTARTNKIKKEHER